MPRLLRDHSITITSDSSFETEIGGDRDSRSRLLPPVMAQRTYVDQRPLEDPYLAGVDCIDDVNKKLRFTCNTTSKATKYTRNPTLDLAAL
jgi:hypothetical protein